MSRGIRKNITIPGALAPALRLRFRECQFRTLSPFVVDLVIYDLQRGTPHTITVAIARDTQDAVDAELVAHPRPGQPRDEAPLVQLIQRLTEVRLGEIDAESAVPLSATARGGSPNQESRARRLGESHRSLRGPQPQ